MGIERDGMSGFSGLAFAKCAGKIAFCVKAYFWQWVSDIMRTWKESGKKRRKMKAWMFG